MNYICHACISSKFYKALKISVRPKMYYIYFLGRLYPHHLLVWITRRSHHLLVWIRRRSHHQVVWITRRFSLIWCMSAINNVKSRKKINETAETANFTDFSLTSCGNRSKWTKTMQTQTRRVRLQIFLRGIQICHMKADVLEIPKMWWFSML